MQNQNLDIPHTKQQKFQLCVFTFERFHAIKIFQEASSHSKILKLSSLRKNGCSMLMWKENEIISFDSSMFDCNLAQNTKAWILFSDLLEFWLHQDLLIWILLHSMSRHSINNSQRLIICKYIYLFVVEFIWLLITFSFSGCQSNVINRVFLKTSWSAACGYKKYWNLGRLNQWGINFQDFRKFHNTFERLEKMHEM